MSSYIKLAGDRFEVAEPVEMGQSVIFQGRGSVVTISHYDNQNGTTNQVARIKPELLEVKKDALEPTPAITKSAYPSSKSMSKRLRDKLFILYQFLNLPAKGINFEDFYEDTINSYLKQVGEKIDYLQSLGTE